MMRVFMIFDNSLKLNIVLDSEALSGALQYRLLVKGSVIWKQFPMKNEQVIVDTTTQDPFLEITIQREYITEMKYS